MNERLRTDFNYNLHLLKNIPLEDAWLKMPIIKAIQDYPDELIGFNYVKTMSRANFSKGVHFYLDDYQFERVWNQPELYIEMLRKFYFVLTPDFSLYTDMPKPLQIYNVYRSRLLGAYWQSRGLNVIPTLSWSDEDSFDFAFSGLETDGVVSVSTVGVIRNQEAKKLWIAGMEEMISRIDPSVILLYGKPIEFKNDKAKIINIESTNMKKVK